MKINRWYQSLRWRLLGIVITSLFLGGITTGVLLLIAGTLYGSQVPLIGGLLVLLDQTIGAIPVTLLTAMGLTFSYYLFLSRPMIRSIEAIAGAMKSVARGNFAISLPPMPPDELGLLGQNMINMARQLEQSIAQERQANEARHELITSVSHDLRTPLTSVLGYLGLIVQDRYKDEVELRYYTDVAYEKGLQLKRLIDQLFEFTRTSHGGITLRPMRLNLVELFEQVAEEFVPALNEAEMKYQLKLPPGRVEVSADPDLLVRVLENLITNAIQYGHEGKVVELELEPLAAEGVVALRVANRGTPIPETDLPHLFDTFYRVERSRSGRTGGTGLGLAITRNITHLHGGTIRAYNQLGRTIFEVRLPLGSS